MKQVQQLDREKRDAVAQKKTLEAALAAQKKELDDANTQSIALLESVRKATNKAATSDKRVEQMAKELASMTQAATTASAMVSCQRARLRRAAAPVPASPAMCPRRFTLRRRTPRSQPLMTATQDTATRVRWTRHPAPRAAHQGVQRARGHEGRPQGWARREYRGPALDARW